MTDAELLELVRTTAEDLQKRIGPWASIVVMVSDQTPEHSYPAVFFRGACLPVIGLLEVGAKLIRGLMPEAYRRS